jgi:hypothetical protein
MELAVGVQGNDHPASALMTLAQFWTMDSQGRAARDPLAQ